MYLCNASDVLIKLSLVTVFSSTEETTVEIHDIYVSAYSCVVHVHVIVCVYMYMHTACIRRF